MYLRIRREELEGKWWAMPSRSRQAKKAELHSFAGPLQCREGSPLR